MFGTFYSPWSKHKAFYHKGEEGAHAGGKIKAWPPGLCSAWMGNILISPFDVFLRASALCPALKRPCPYHQSRHYLQLISLLQEPPSLKYLSTFYMVSTQRTK